MSCRSLFFWFLTAFLKSQSHLGKDFCIKFTKSLFLRNPSHRYKTPTEFENYIRGARSNPFKVLGAGLACRDALLGRGGGLAGRWRGQGGGESGGASNMAAIRAKQQSPGRVTFQAHVSALICHVFCITCTVTCLHHVARVMSPSSRVQSRLLIT